ncbi:MAG: hypothetical protein J4A00_10460 [Gammaproteobacteria bacterium]|nr:hypothetical protein [Gammaproteobacteria bacterium]
MGGYLILFFGVGGVALGASILGLLIYLAVSCANSDGALVWLLVAGVPVGYCQGFWLVSGLLLLLGLMAIRQHAHKRRRSGKP